MISWLNQRFRKDSQPDYHTAHLVLSYLETNLEFSTIKDLLLLKYNSLESYTQAFYKENIQVYQHLTSVFSNQNILKYAIENNQFKSSMKSLLLKQLSYPFILYFVMYFLLGFFSMVLLPTLISMISMFELDTTLTNVGYTIIKGIFYVLCGLNLFILVVILLLLKKENQKLLFHFLNHSKILYLPKKLISHEFVYLYNLLQNYGLSTKQSLDVMRRGSKSYLVSWLAYLSIERLEQGKTLVESFDHKYLDTQFISLLTLATKNNQQLELLNTYLHSNERIIEILIIKLSKLIKTVVYIILGLLIIFLYQILLSPMSLMSTL